MLLALILTLPRLPKDKASFLRRSKGAGVDAKRDKAGVGEKGGHAGRHTASPEVSSPCGAGSRWELPKCHKCTGLPGGSSPTPGRDGDHGGQQRALPSGLQNGPSYQLTWLSW